MITSLPVRDAKGRRSDSKESFIFTGSRGDHHNTSKYCHLITPLASPHHTVCTTTLHQLSLNKEMQCLQCKALHWMSCLTSVLYPSTVPNWGSLPRLVKGKCLFFKFVREMSQAESWANQCPGMAWPGLTGVMLEYFIIEMFILVICKYYRFTFLLNYNCKHQEMLYLPETTINSWTGKKKIFSFETFFSNC